jgi:quercetin dioxygenase-like cupin family protein
MTDYKAVAAGEGLERISVPGETLRFKVTGDDTGGALDYLVLTIDPGCGPPLHIHHTQHETIHFLQGRFKVQVEDEVFISEPGGFVSFPIGVRHCFVNLSDQPCDCILTFSPGHTDRFFEDFGPAVRQSEGAPDPAVLGPIFAKHTWELAGPPLSADERLEPAGH